MFNIQTTLAALETAAEKTVKALLRRTDIKVIASGTNAHYNWREKSLHVPAYSLREDTEEKHAFAWRGILDHECAHVEFSDGDEYDRRIEKWRQSEDFDLTRVKTFANVYEDFMIERRWRKLNPGSRKHLDACNTVVIEETGGAKACDPEHLIDGKHPVGFFSALVQAMLRVGGGWVKMEEVPTLIQQLLDFLSAEIEIGMKAQNSAEVCDAAELTWLKLKELKDKLPEEEKEKEESEGEGEGEGEGGKEGKGEEGEGEGGGGTPSSLFGDDEKKKAGEGEGDEKEKENEESGEGEGKGDNEESESSGGKNSGVEKSASEKEGGGVGAGTKEAELIEAADACFGGQFAEMKKASEVLAGLFLSDPDCRPYLVSPAAKEADHWTRYDAKKRQEVKKQAVGLRQAAGRSATVMANLLRCAVKAQRQSLWVGGLEEGSELDPDALPALAGGFNDSRVFADTFSQLDNNAFVCVLVDCSGSMGQSKPSRCCPTHGFVNQKGENCSRKLYTGSKCGEPLTWKVTSKAGYAAMTATVLHDALRLCGVKHCVLGYTNSHYPDRVHSPKVSYRQADGSVIQKPKWARDRSALWMHEFVPSPGLSDDGGALPYITGYFANLDGESVLEAAKYSVANAKDCDRVIMLVIADGLPAGADDSELEDDYLRDSVAKVAQAGIEVYAIGVGIGVGRSSWARRHLKAFKSFYPEVRASAGRAATGHVLIEDGEGLSNTVMKQLCALLIRSNGRGRRR